MIEARIAKLVMVGSLAVFALLAAADNVIDYDTNFEFVGHVLSMDTTFRQPGAGSQVRSYRNAVVTNLRPGT